MPTEIATAPPSKAAPHRLKGFPLSLEEEPIAGQNTTLLCRSSRVTSVYSARGEARLHAGHDQGRRERVGRLAAALQLRTDTGDANRAPCQVLRTATKDSGREGACPLSHLLRPACRDPVAILLGTLSCPGSPRTAAASIVPPRRPLSSRRPRWPAWVRRDLEGPRVP